MKKIIGLMLACLVLLSGTCFAKIATMKDDFNGSSWQQSDYVRTTYRGFFDPHDDLVVFGKANGKYFLAIGETTHGVQGTVTFDQNAEIKLDGVIYNNIPFSLLERSGDYDNGGVCGYYRIPDELVSKIKMANQIYVRTSWQNNGSSSQITVQIPTDIKQEWKQI